MECPSGKMLFGPEKPRRGFWSDPLETAPGKAAQAAGIASSCRAFGYETASGRSLWKVYGPDLNGRFGGLQGTGGLEAVILDADGTTTGVINDQFGNGVASVSGTGSGASVTWNTTRVGAYGPLPGIQAQTLTDVTQLAAATAWRSRRIDPTGFYWLGARYYEPTSGRFLSADPMGQAASPSLYDYAGGDPVNSFDPDGRCAKGQNGQDNGDGTFMWNGSRVPYNQGDGRFITPMDLATNNANAINAQNSASGQSTWSAAWNAAMQGGASYIQGLGNGLQGAATGTMNALLNPIGAIQGVADQIGTAAGMLVYDRSGLATDIGNTLTNPYQLGTTVGNVVGSTAIGAGINAVGGAVIGQAADVGTVAGSEPTTVIGRVNDLQNLAPGEQSLLDRLPDQGDPQANWQQNSGVLRQEMNRGLPIRDASPGDTGGQFLNAERNLLQDRGWTPNPDTNMWMPPPKG
jgi:RHS repeat-associated protein